jgi:hypothetical protein
MAADGHVVRLSVAPKPRCPLGPEEDMLSHQHGPLHQPTMPTTEIPIRSEEQFYYGHIDAIVVELSFNETPARPEDLA